MVAPLIVVGVAAIWRDPNLPWDVLGLFIEFVPFAVLAWIGRHRD